MRTPRRRSGGLAEAAALLLLPRRFYTNLQAANQLLAEFLSGPRDARKLGLERRKYLAQVLGAERSIDAYLAVFDSAGQRSGDGHVPSAEQDLCMARGQRMSVRAIRDGLAGIGRIYPDMAEVGPMLTKADAALDHMGDNAQMTAAIRALASVRLKPALSNNPEWIAGFRSAFPRLVSGQSIIAIHLYSANWYIHKNEITSYPEYRQIGAWIAARQTDGTCWIHTVDLWQDYTGNGYETGEYRLGGPPRQVLCEHL